MTEINPNARFWDLINGSPVKLTLRPGQALNWYNCHMTDEGFHAERQMWHYDGERVVCKADIQARDCDGRYDHNHESSCEIDQVQSGNIDGTGDCDDRGNPIVYPAWTSKGSSQRDHSAEAMGY